MTKILLVEDDQVIRAMMSERLERKGYQIVTAADGKQATMLAQSEKPKLILM